MEFNLRAQRLSFSAVRCKYDFSEEYTAFASEKKLPDFDKLTLEERAIYIAMVADLEKSLKQFKRCLTKLNANESIFEDHDKLPAAFKWRHESIKPSK